MAELEEAPQTPLMHTVNAAHAYDLNHRATAAEVELSTIQTKLAREKRKTRRLQSQIQEYMEALAQCVEQCTLMRNHCHIMSNTNLALSQELQKGKFMVETLEAVLQMLYKSAGGFGTTGIIPSNGECE
jgi:predicted RNase H-like nuclease (RuvC/YqgF family)